MHVAIELNQLRVTHVHPVADIVSGLAYLESAKLKDVLFDDTESPNFLDGLTTAELSQLYLNLTGGSFPPGFDDLARREALAQVIGSLNFPSVNADELSAQIDHVADALEKPTSEAIQFRYVFGSREPSVLSGGLFPISTAPASSEQLAQAKQQAPLARKQRAVAAVPAVATQAPRPKVAGPRAATGGARPVIWAHADASWEKAGKPMDAATVLVLRKQMMVELEEQHGIKKSTSSTALGDWMKARLNP